MVIFWEPIIWSFNLIFDTYTSSLIIIIQVTMVGYFLFFLGIIGFIIRKTSLMYILIAVELMFLGINLVSLFLGYLLFQPFLQIIVLLLLTIAAAETAVLLSMIFLYHRLFNSTSLFLLRNLRY